MSRTKVEWRSGSKLNYKKFCKENPLIKLTYQEWRSIMRTYNEEFRTYILETGEKARLPHGLGQFSIVKKKRKKYTGTGENKRLNLPIDWQKTKEKGKIIYNMNYHTEGYFFGWIWFKPALLKQPTIWHFKPSRPTSRILARYIKSEKKYMNIYRAWNG